MSTVDVIISGDTPAVLPVDVDDAIAASQAALIQCQSVLTETEQTGQAAAESAAIASAAAAAAQNAASINAYKRKEVSNANYAADASDVYVGFKGLTGPVTLQLPLASVAVPGRAITVADVDGSCSSAHAINVTLSGSDTIIGVPTSPSIQAPGGMLEFFPTAENGWTMR